jgi:type I restriction enzyme S subunit
MNEKATVDDFSEEDNPVSEDSSEPDLVTSLDETSVGNIPSDWSSVRLEEFTRDTLYGANESAEDYDPDKPRYIRIKDIDERGRLKEEEKASLSQEKAEGYLLEKGDMLFARSGSPGRTYLHRHNKGEYCYGGYSIKHELLLDRLNHEYLSQYTKSQRYWDWIERIARTGAQANINSREYASLLIPLPPRSEQRKIATVLNNVDQVIQNTEEIIEQIKRVKLGVSQHYFGEYDTIRRDENPESVEMVELSNLVDFKPGKAWKTKNLSDDGLKIVRISNLTGEKNDYWHYNGEYEERRVIEDGGLLFSWAGMKSSIGVHIYRGEKALLNQHIYNLIPKSNISRKYLYYYLDYRMSDLYSLSQGGAVQIHLTKDIIERILIPELDSEKREAIVTHLNHIDDALQNEIAQKSRLQRLKRGLMQDLLSGTVRTTDTDIEVPEEITQYG